MIAGVLIRLAPAQARMASCPPSLLLPPLDVITFFLTSGGRTTNLELVRHFHDRLAVQGKEGNKAILKVGE